MTEKCRERLLNFIEEEEELCFKIFKSWKIITEKGTAETTGMHLPSIFILKLHLKKKIF